MADVLAFFFVPGSPSPMPFGSLLDAPLCQTEAASDGRACTASLFLFWRRVTPTDVAGEGPSAL